MWSRSSGWWIPLTVISSGDSLVSRVGVVRGLPVAPARVAPALLCFSRDRRELEVGFPLRGHLQSLSESASTPVEKPPWVEYPSSSMAALPLSVSTRFKVRVERSVRRPW